LRRPFFLPPPAAARRLVDLARDLPRADELLERAPLLVLRPLGLAERRAPAQRVLLDALDIERALERDLALQPERDLAFLLTARLGLHTDVHTILTALITRYSAQTRFFIRLP